MSILYHHGKANVVVDYLRRMTMSSVYHVGKAKKDVVKDSHRFDLLGV